MSKTLILHIGTLKTGSTAIQHFLQDNVALFEEQGFGVFLPKGRYPTLAARAARNGGIDQTGGFLKRYYNFVYRKKKVASQKTNIVSFDPDTVDYIQKTATTDMADFISFAKSHDSIILSDENLYCLSVGFWPFVKTVAEDNGFDRIKIVLYLRRQDLYIDSLYRQLISNGRSLPEGYQSQIKSNPLQLDYNAALQNIERVFDKDCITVRRYKRQDFSGEDVRQDFCKAIGITWNDDFVLREEVTNPSISLDLAEVRRITNQVPAVQQSNGFLGMHSKRIATINQDNEAHSLFSTDDARAFLAHYKEGNQAISERYFDGDPLFDDVAEGQVAWQRDTDQTLNVAIMLFTDVITQQYEQIEHQRLELEHQRAELEHQRAELEHKHAVIRDLRMRTERIERLLHIPQLLKLKHKFFDKRKET